MFLLIGSFIAGVITVLSPCVLPLLPIIIGGSVSGKVEDKKRPLIIAASLAVSLIVFTVLLKATTLFIDIPPLLITAFSGIILVLLGISLLFPSLYDRLIIKLNLQAKSQQLLAKSGGKGKYTGAIVTGAALGPVFSSCSPVYAYIIATILPVSFGQAMLYITAYVIGLSAVLLLIGYLGQRFLKRVKFIANPRGWFIRTVAALFIIVGVIVGTGNSIRAQTWVSEYTPFKLDKLTSALIPSAIETDDTSVLNVKPYEAPEFKDLSNWINSKPLTKQDLKGKVVLIDFWTYSCINCIRTQPYLKDWYANYKDSGFVVLGLHAPEFSFEKNPANVRDAVKKAGLEYPVALDNDFMTWNAYQNQYWPGTYLLDKNGQVRRYHGGEGGYKETEQAIRTLLKEDGGSVPDRTTKALDGKVPFSEAQTPETYLGTRQASNFVGTPLVTAGTGQRTFTPGELKDVDDWTLGGTWDVSTEGIKAVSDSTLRFRVAAKEVYFVTAGDGGGKQITMNLNGQPISQTGFAGSDVKDSNVTVNEGKLYRAVRFKSFQKDATIELTVPAGVQLNVFTFGS